MSTRRRNEPVPLRDALAAVGRDLGLPDPDAFTAFLDAWPELVGAEIAQHARVRSLRDGVCTVAVDDAAWATQLRYLTDGVLADARKRCGTSAPSRIRVVVEPPRETRAEGPARRTRPVY